MWPASLRSVVPTVWPVGLFENYCKPLRGGMCHVPCATNRLMSGTIVVPAFWRVEWCHAGPDRTIRSGAIPENAWTHILTDWLTDRQTRPANYFSPTHQWKSSFIERSMLKHLNVHSLRFWINENMFVCLFGITCQYTNGKCQGILVSHGMPITFDYVKIWWVLRLLNISIRQLSTP